MEKETSTGNKKRDYLLPASIIIAAVLISGSLIYFVGSRNTPPTTQNNLSDNSAAGSAVVSNLLKISDNDVVMGDPKAPVTIIEYGDYQCPFCARFSFETESLVREDYVSKGKVKVIFRNFQFLGPESVEAGEAAECARDQGKFWNYHDAIFNTELADGYENNGNLNRDFFLRTASNLEMDEASFSSCLNGHKYLNLVKSETSAAKSAGINSTPTVFINNTWLTGALPYVNFSAAIDEVLARE